MEKVMSLMTILKPKPNPQQLLREWQRRLRQECRNIERQIGDIQREEKNVQKAIREAAKMNDIGSAKVLSFPFCCWFSSVGAFFSFILHIPNSLYLFYSDCSGFLDGVIRAFKVKLQVFYLNLSMNDIGLVSCYLLGLVSGHNIQKINDKAIYGLY